MEVDQSQLETYNNVVEAISVPMKNFGTPEGRRKGGLASLITHNSKSTGFVVAKRIKRPKESKTLAEFVGIMFGDGHMSKYQAMVTTNSVTDLEHGAYVASLMQQLFGIKTRTSVKRSSRAIDVVASSRTLVDFLHSKGMPLGNKISHNLSVPRWILGNVQYRKSFVRGLFDTDGSVYLDKHVVKGKLYRHLGCTITSYADRLLSDIVNILVAMDFRPTNRPTQKSVFIRRQSEIHRYFKEIGTSNPKHLERYLRFIGRVPKRS